MKLTVSKRAQRTETAVIDDLLELYGGLTGIVNLAPGSPAITPSAAVRDAAAEAARDPAVSMYGDVLGYAPLRACWMQRVLADWEPWTLREEAVKAGACKEEDYGLELMVTAGANQGFFITILALCDAGDEVVLFAPYYFSHYNALTACGVAPVVVECDPTTLLPRDVGAVRDAFTPRTKAVVLVSPGNPSGVVVPRAFVDALCALCKEKDVWVISDEAYKEISYDGEEVYVPRPLAGVVRMYTMSKVYGLAGWRVGALLYPKCLSVHLRKMQDTIPTHATILSQVVALRAFELDLPRIPRRVLDFAVTRASFLRHLAEVYDERPDLHVVLGSGAYYLFLPVGEERRGREGSGEEKEVVSFLAQKAKVLVVPGSAFGMRNYIRVSFGSVPMDRAEAAAKVLKAGLMAWFSALPESS